MGKKLCLIHSTDNFMELIYRPFAEPFKKANPDVEIINICDGSLLADTLKFGKMTNQVARRVLEYVFCAENMGADMAMITCSSINEAAKHIRKFSSIPVINIDEPLAKMAVSAGTKIGVLATLPTSPSAVVRLLNEEARNIGKKIDTVIKVADGAFHELIAGNPEKHDEIVMKALADLSGEADIVVFSQISMSRVDHKNYQIPVFKIGESGFDEVKKVLGLYNPFC